MIGATDAVQYAFVQAMLADAGISALVGTRVLDDIPDNEQFPYISLGAEDWQPFEDNCLTGAEGVVQIDIWSAAPGREECKAITERVTDLFNGDAPVVPDGGFVIISTRVILAQVMRDQGSRTRHGVVQVEVTVERNDA